MNEDISQLGLATQLGPVLGDERALRYGLHTKTYLDHAFLGSVRGNTPDHLATEMRERRLPTALRPYASSSTRAA